MRIALRSTALACTFGMLFACTQPAIKPAVPPVPDSPLKVYCAKLPTQVERDTCTNRKLSTG